MDSRRSSAVFYNGKIFTLGGKKKCVRAIAVDEGRIVGAGDDSEARTLSPRGSTKFDLGGKVVLPGFIDCHTHFIQMGLDSLSVNLARTTSLDEALRLIREAGMKSSEGDWVIATNWKESGWSNGRFLTRQDLDSCCPNNPVVAHRVCGHLSTVNSKAMSLLSIDPGSPEVDTEKGILREGAVSIPRAATAPDRRKKEQALTTATRMAHALGVTSIQDNGASGDFETYHTAEKRGRLGVRIWFNTPGEDLESRIKLGISTGFGTDLLKLGGVKAFCDGALGARTAALSSPYADDPGNIGLLVHEKAELDTMVSRANDAGLQVALHAIGDVGISTAISALSRALERNPDRNARHRIEHLELPSKKHLFDMRKNSIIASMQPNFIGEWGGTDGMYTARLGKERVGSNNPFRHVLDSKVRLAFGSDCMPFSPIYGIHSAVNAPHQSQRLTPHEAIVAYTRDAAFPTFDEHTKGTLEPGRLADFVVLSRDPYIEPSTISSITVLKTILGGLVVFDRTKARQKQGRK